MKKFDVYEYELMPVRKVMESVTGKDIQEKFGVSQRHAYPGKSLIFKKYKVVHEGEVVSNRYANYFAVAASLLSKYNGKTMEENMKMAIAVWNGNAGE